MRNYKNYDIWKKAHEFTIEVYKETKHFPDSEKFGLTNQIRRATTSIPLNIVEGSGRETEADFRRFLFIAASSAGETEYLIQLCRELEFLQDDIASILEDKINHLRRMIYNFIKALK